MYACILLNQLRNYEFLHQSDCFVTKIIIFDNQTNQTFRTCFRIGQKFVKFVDKELVDESGEQE